MVVTVAAFRQVEPPADSVGFFLLAGLALDLRFHFLQYFGKPQTQSVCNPDRHWERGTTLAALDEVEVGAIDLGKLRQLRLRETFCLSCCSQLLDDSR